VIILKKVIFIILAIFLCLVLVALGVFFWLTSSTTTTAYLNIEQGKVQVNQGKGWIDAVDEMTLRLDDKVKTLANGKASLVLYESTIISLDPDTEVSLTDLSKEHLRIRQDSGSTWNKFTGLLGVQGLSVETPNTVATVRGTSFEVTLDSVMVGEGVVEVSFEGEKITIKQDEKVVLEEREGIKRLVKKMLSKTDDKRLLEKMERTVEVMKKIRKREINKKKIVVERLKKRYHISEKEIDESLDQADQGLFDLDEIEEKSPVKMEAVKRVKALTERIIKQNLARQRLREKVQSNVTRDTSRVPEKKTILSKAITR